MAKQNLKTAPYLQGSVAKEKIMKKLPKIEAISDINSFEIRLRESSDTLYKAWRIKFEGGIYAMCCMDTGKVLQYTSQDVLSTKPLGDEIKYKGQKYKKQKFEGQAPFYYR